MISLIIVLLSFSSSLARDQTKFLFLIDEPCIVRFAHIDLNPVELNYYPFLISLNKCTGFLMSYHQKYAFQKKQMNKFLK